MGEQLQVGMSLRTDLETAFRQPHFQEPKNQYSVHKMWANHEWSC